VVVKQINKIFGRLGLILMLWGASAASGSIAAETAGVRDNLFQVLDWNGYDMSAVLEDGTSMYSYVAESPSLPVEGSSKPEHNATMRFTFFPRFKCSPLIELVGVMPDNITVDDRITTLRNFNKVSLLIDDEPFEYPALVEEKNSSVKSYFNASLQRRTTLRILVELGDFSEITFGDGTKTSFSLIGSRDTISQAMGRCRNHK